MTLSHLLSKLYKYFLKLWSLGYTARFAMVSTVLLLFRNVVYMRVYRKYYKLPNGPNGVPLLGVIPQARILGAVKWNGTVLPRYGPVVSYPIGAQMFLLINDPAIARYVYSLKISRNRFEPFLDTVSNTITFLNGPNWYQRRKNIHSNLIAMLNTQFVTVGSIKFLKQVLFPYLDKHSYIDHIKPILSPLTFNLVLYGCTGHHLQSMDDPFFTKFDALVQQFWSVMRLRIFIAYIIGTGRRYNIFFKNFLNLSALGEELRMKKVKMVIDFVKQNAPRNIDNKKLCFYDLMKMSAESNDENDGHLKLTEQEIYSDITALLHPSVDTTANTLGFAIFLLCKYPQIQDTIYEKELKVLFDDDINNINLTQTNLQKLVQFQALIHEAMRIYPTTLFSSPHFVKNYDDNGMEEKIKIEIDGNESYEIASNCQFAINTIGIHRNPKFWVKNRDDYRRINMMEPHLEFWIDENGKFKSHKSLCVFSFGKRECIGKQVAIKNLYVILSALMMRYRFTVDKPNKFTIPVDECNLLTPGPCRIYINRRNSSF